MLLRFGWLVGLALSVLLGGGGCCFVVVLLFSWSFLFVCFVFTDLHEAPRGFFFWSLKKQLFSIWTVLFPSDLNTHLLLLNTFFLFFMT